MFSFFSISITITATVIATSVDVVDYDVPILNITFIIVLEYFIVIAAITTIL